MLKGACAVFLTVVAVVSLGCSYSRPQNADKPMALKVTKPHRHSPTPGQSGEDFSLDYHGSSVLRHDLPLSGTKWEWEGELNAEGFVGMDDPSAYKLEFKPDGWFDFQADCRHGSGIYEVHGEHIALAVIKSSTSACPRGSLTNDFQSALELVRTFSLADSKLFFDLKRSEKTMIFHLKP